MRELSLFTGAGGGLYGSLLLGWTPVCAVEKDPYRRKVLEQRQRDGIFPDFPIHDDVRVFDGIPWRGRVDVVSGGFPCQPFSVAGSRRGEADERNMWSDTIRIIREIRPRFAFLENVPGLLSSGYFGRILGDLAESGYDAEWTCLGADDCGAPHRRKRLWILAHDQERGRESRRTGRFDPSRPGQSEQPLQAVADTHAGRLEIQRLGGLLNSEWSALGHDADGRNGTSPWWATEPNVGRVANGVAARKHRLAALGDGQVPLVAATAWRILNG